MDPEYESRLSQKDQSIRKSENKNDIKLTDRLIPFRREDQDTLYELGATPSDNMYEQVLKNEMLDNKQRGIYQYKITKEPSETPFTTSPMGLKSQKLLTSPKRNVRKISRTPFKILEAPTIQDDFYMKLVDWSSKNILAVALTSSVYLWNAVTNRVTKLCEMANRESITSVRWVQRGTHLAIGSNNGAIEIWDISVKKKIRTYTNHSTRVGALDWCGHTLTSGSRDRSIYHRDVRTPEPYSLLLKGHKQEVCGIEWSPDGRMLASGGNDNQLLIWDKRGTTPLIKYDDHTAAVKAISWSPHQRGLLASGGGTADRCIRFRNTLTGTTINSIDTGSQVCNIAWSKNVNEIVSTHGYSQNQIVIWNYPSMTTLATLTGHSMRVLYLSVSPDGSTIVTGAGDQTLRFWNVFPSKEGPSSALSSGSLIGKLEIR